MKPRPDISQERKNQIIDAAMTVFSKMGFSKARMDDIVEESGLSKGTLYWYFKSKDDIIIAILENLFEREFADLEPILGQTEGTISQRLSQFVEYTVSDIQRMLKLMPLAYEFYALAFRQTAVRQALKSYLYHYLEMLDPVVQEAIERGEFRPVDPRDVSIALGAIVEGTILLWVYDPEIVDIDHHAQFATSVFLDGLKTKPSMGLRPW